MAAKEPTLESQLNEWLEIYVKPCKRENTYLCYKFIISALCRLRPDFKDLPPTHFNEKGLQKSLNEAAQTYSKSTVKKMKIVLNSTYEMCARNQICDENPAISLTIPEAKEKEIRAFTQEEEAKVRAAASHITLGHLVIFFLDTGVRPNELAHIKWDDYSAVKNEIEIRRSKTKNGIRVVPLISEAKEIIEKQPHYCEYIFTSTTHNPVTKTVLRKLYMRLRKATGISIATNNVFRHSFATRMVEKNASSKALSKIMGHKSIAFTLQRYASAETKFLHDEIKKLEPVADVRVKVHIKRVKVQKVERHAKKAFRP